MPSPVVLTNIIASYLERVWTVNCALSSVASNWILNVELWLCSACMAVGIES